MIVNYILLKMMLRKLPTSQHVAVKTAFQYLNSDDAFEAYVNNGTPNFNELIDLCAEGYNDHELHNTEFGRDIFITALELVQY